MTLRQYVNARLEQPAPTLTPESDGTVRAPVRMFLHAPEVYCCSVTVTTADDVGQLTFRHPPHPYTTPPEVYTDRYSL